MSNVPDDWGSFWATCSRCGNRYHQSEGGCGCEDYYCSCGEQLDDEGLCPVCDVKEAPAMTAGQLIEELKKFDPKTEIVMARDPEGNGYSPLSEDYSYLFWHNDEPYSEEEAKDYDVDTTKTSKVLVFWPVY